MRACLFTQHMSKKEYTASLGSEWHRGGHCRLLRENHFEWQPTKCFHCVSMTLIWKRDIGGWFLRVISLTSDIWTWSKRFEQKTMEEKHALIHLLHLCLVLINTCSLFQTKTLYFLHWGFQRVLFQINVPRTSFESITPYLPSQYWTIYIFSSTLLSRWIQKENPFISCPDQRLDPQDSSLVEECLLFNTFKNQFPEGNPTLLRK